jgi:hypothetical protein
MRSFSAINVDVMKSKACNNRFDPCFSRQLFNPTKAEPELMGGPDEVPAKVGRKPYHE